MRNLEDVERDIYRVQHILRTLHFERNLLLEALAGLETSAKILTEQAMEKMRK